MVTEATLLIFELKRSYWAKKCSRAKKELICVLLLSTKFPSK